MRDHVQGYKGLLSGHVCGGSMARSPDSRSSIVTLSASKAHPSFGVTTKRILPSINFLSAKTLSNILRRGNHPERNRFPVEKRPVPGDRFDRMAKRVPKVQ